MGKAKNHQTKLFLQYTENIIKNYDIMYRVLYQLIF